MAGSTTVGALRVLLTADSAQITSDLGKARKAVRDARDDFALFGRGGKDAEKVLVEIGSASHKEMGKARQAIGLLTSSFGSLGGTVGKVGSLIGDLTTGNLGAFGVSAAAAAAAVTYAVSTISEAVKEARGAQEDAVRAAQAGLRNVREFGAQRFDAQRGTDLAPLAAAEEKVTAAVQERARLYQEMRDSGPGSIVGATRKYLAAEEAVNEAIRERARAYTRAEDAQNRALRSLDDAMRQMRSDREDDFFLSRLPEDARRAEKEIGALKKTLSGLVEKVGMSEEDAAAAVRAGLVDYDTARKSTEARADAEKRAAAFLREQAAIIHRRAVTDSIASIEAEVAALEDELLLKQRGGEQDRKDFDIRKRITELQEKAHRFDLEDPNSVVNRKIALLTKVLHLNRQIRQIEEEPGKEADAERLRKLQQDAADAAREAAESRQRQRDRDFQAFTDALGAKLEAENRVAETIAHLHDTETDREVAAVREKYQEELDLAQDYGLDVVELEKFIAAEQGRIRAEHAQKARKEDMDRAMTGDDLGKGFEARVTQIAEEEAAWGRLGAQLANVATYDLSGGVVGALEQVVKGSASAAEAFRAFASDFAFQVARMIEQALVMEAILAIFKGLGVSFPGAAAAPGATPTGAAHGGTFRVPGYGGLDSQLVQMRLSPGEIVKVSNGANSGGEGIVLHNNLVVRSLVFADEQAAKMSREAKAGIVASAVSRGSRRGGRPAE